jgi:Tfp pilus assembly protein PilP
MRVGGVDVINYARFQTIISDNTTNTGDDDDDDEFEAAARREATRQIQAVMNIMPFQQTEAYFEASLRAPRIVQTESDPLLFLR